jgi:excinuclease ABC subunit C
MIDSALDAVPGLGPARRSALIDAFGSVAAIRAASPDELARVPGIGPGLARTIAAALGSAAEAHEPTVNTATGEITQ